MRQYQHNRHFQVFVQADYEEVSLRAARLLLHHVREKPDTLLCAATGGSPTRAYDLFCDPGWHHRASYDRMRVIKLDEWGGLPPGDPGTCEVYLKQHLLDSLRIPPERYMGFKVSPPDPQADCERVAAELDERGPIDVCVLGLGTNGHLGFNEPADELQPHAHVATLSEASLDHPMVRHNRDAVKFGMTLGIGDILHSRHVLLLVNGAPKREPLTRLMSGGVSTQFPASCLWLHPSVTCICDADAAEGL
ncbi:MAG TPA: 6-phosphogluconolactonase [Tepidisphaeraceae bacterium]|jgi:galactosamine-6-phosphate isomerase|nr:6-phosphogluconolactonase [Tepidisphaeraceae bacterium]